MTVDEHLAKTFVEAFEFLAAAQFFVEIDDEEILISDEPLSHLFRRFCTDESFGQIGLMLQCLVHRRVRVFRAFIDDAAQGTGAGVQLRRRCR
ncbi:MAG: hypothetical protein D6737_14350, partial [Chloroflexi bacterium]